MNSQIRAILWAQARTIWNYFPRSSKFSLAFSVIVSVIWYGMWSLLAVVAAKVLAEPGAGRVSGMVLSGGFLLVFIYWQMIPVLMATTGASLELRKLVVYPVPHSQLFLIEALLRVTTGIEMLLLLVGAAVGLARNPAMPRWSPLVLLPFVVFNLCFAAGTREILARLFARKRVREIAVFLLVLCGALPQLLVATGMHGRLRGVFQFYDASWLPWSVTAAAAQGISSGRNVALLLGWTALAYAYGRWQFERGLAFDADAARATVESKERSTSALSEALYRWPARVFVDPLAALVEKEIRVMSRAPRFRLVFTMGFTFGLVIWLPIAGRAGAPGFMSRNYLTLVCLYALLLLGDVCFWNALGFDRKAAQMYFVAPVRFATVLIAKNISALFFVLLEISLIMTVCALLRMPMAPAKLVEAYSVTLVITLYLLAVGNLTSTHNPRGVNPEKSMRTGATGRLQALLVLVYPIAGLPVMLAYGARYAFQSNAAFFIVLGIAGAIGMVVYWVAMESSVGAAEREREMIVDRLAQGEGLVQA